MIRFISDPKHEYDFNWIDFVMLNLITSAKLVTLYLVVDIRAEVKKTQHIVRKSKSKSLDSKHKSKSTASSSQKTVTIIPKN